MVKYLIINADDFGYSRVFNEVILDLIKQELVRSTTVMVNRVNDSQKQQFDELVSLSKTMNLSVGLHLEFSDTNYDSQIESQYEKFEEIVGFKPSHIDIHKSHAFRGSYLQAIDFCSKKGIPCRNRGGDYGIVKTTFTKAFFGSIKDFGKIKEWIKSFEDGKFYEIIFHPGKYDPECKSSLNKER